MYTCYFSHLMYSASVLCLLFRFPCMFDVRQDDAFILEYTGSIYATVYTRAQTISELHLKKYVEPTYPATCICDLFLRS